MLWSYLWKHKKNRACKHRCKIMSLSPLPSHRQNHAPVEIKQALQHFQGIVSFSSSSSLHFWVLCLIYYYYFFVSLSSGLFCFSIPSLLSPHSPLSLGLQPVFACTPTSASTWEKVWGYNKFRCVTHTLRFASHHPALLSHRAVLA